MGTAREVAAVTRRFLQARRREPLHLKEISRLLDKDASYVEIIDGETWTVIGANAIAEILRDLWARRGDDESMRIVRLALTGASTSVGHWTRTTSDGRVVHGRDRYTVRNGVIAQVEVEEFDLANVPRLLHA